MVESSITQTDETALAIRRIQWFTIVWMAIEVAVAFIAAIQTHSVALAAFGGDSAIELLSAAVVLARFHSAHGITEKLASIFTGWLLVSLAIYIAANALYTLIAAESKPKPSYLGSHFSSLPQLSCPGLRGASERSRSRQIALRYERMLHRAPSAPTCHGSLLEACY